MDVIPIDVGVFTQFEIDLTSLPSIAVEKYILTIKNYVGDNSPVVIQREFDTADIHTVKISPVESKMLFDRPVYDVIIKFSNGECYKVCENGEVLLNRGVGECQCIK